MIKKLLADIHKIHAMLMKKIELEIYRYNIIHDNKNNNDKEIAEIVKYLKNHKAGFFNQAFKDQKKEEDIIVYRKNNIPYVIRNDKKLFFPKCWSDEKVKTYYLTILQEQNSFSPHRYLTDEIINCKKIDVAIDLGGAEGVFSLDLIDSASKIYIFEADEKWIDALKMTFSEYKEKIIIINKFVSDYNDKKHIRLDDFFEMHTKIDLIKMDIEGDELKALNGSKRILLENDQIILLTCVYHYEKEENEIREQFKEWVIKARPGYVLYHWPEKQYLSKPYLRKCVLEITKNKDYDFQI